MVSSPDGPSDRSDDLDAQWADLTARLGPLDTSDLPDQPDPPLGTSGAPQEPPDDSSGAVAPTDAGPPGPRDYDVARDPDEGRFIPPDPGPVITGSSRNTLPWLGAVGGPLAVLAMLMLWPAAPPAAYLAAMVITIAGLLVLWWRLPVRKDGSDDDGAVV